MVGPQPERRFFRIVRPERRHGPLPLAECLRLTWGAMRRSGVPIYQAALLGAAVGLTMQGLSVAGRAAEELTGEGLFVLFVVGLTVSALSEVAIIQLADHAFRSEGLSLWQAYRLALPRLLPYLATAIVAAALTAIGLLFLVVPGVVALGAFAFWRQAVVLDRSWGSRALLSSSLAALPAVWRIIGVLAVIGFARLGFFDWAVTLAELEGGPAGPILERFSSQVEVMMLAVLAIRVITEPVILTFLTALYRRLASADGWHRGAEPDGPDIPIE